MKKKLLSLSTLLVLAIGAVAQDFSAVPFNSNGYEIYYTIIDANHVAVTCPAPNHPYVIIDTLIDGWLRSLDIIIPDSVTYAGHNYCVSAIADSAFANVRGNYMYMDSYSYLSISLPATISSIGSYAFINDSANVYVYMRGTTPPTIATTSFSGGSLSIISVPCGSESNYTMAWGMPLFNGSVSNNDSYIYPCHTVYINDISTGGRGYVSIRYSSSEYFAEIREISLTATPCDVSSITLWATPDSGFHFSHWSNGSTQDTITITLPHSGLLYAYFESNGIYDIEAVSADTTMGQALGGGLLHYGDTAVLSAVAAEHYHFSHWNDGNTDNPRQYIVEFHDEVFTAYFAPDTFFVNATSNNIVAGNVIGGGTFAYGTPCTLEATAYSGYHFSHWSNGTTYNPYTFAVVADTNLTAIFLADGEEGIDDIAYNGIRIVVRSGKIIVEGAYGATVLIFDMEGRLVDDNLLQTGTYLVKIGDHPARKVVVIR